MAQTFLTGEGPIARLASHVRTPLFGGAYALILSSGVTSVLGILYWTLAARLHDTEEVGVAAAMISTMTFISYLAQLNMAGSLTRFIPTAGPRTRALVSRAYLAAVVLSGVGAALFVFGLDRWASSGLEFDDHAAIAFWFVAATMAWSVFALQDAVLTGLRATVWVPIENAIFAVAKIVLLVAFAASVATYGIFASWTIPAALLVVPVNLLIFRRFLPRHMVARTEAHPEVQPRQILRFLAGDYIGSLFVYATIGLMPLIVLAEIGASASAYFYIAWTIAYSLQLISINMATSLMVEGSARRATLGRDSRRMALLLVRLQVPAIAVLFLGASFILLIFGHAYESEAETLLRLLALGVLPHGINAIYLGVARVRREVGRVIAVQATLAVLTLGLSALLLPLVGIVGVGVAWLTAQTLVSLGVYVTELGPLWRRTALSERPTRRAPRADPTAGLGPGWTAVPLGTRLAAELEASGVSWALLRTDRPEAATGDVDLLVAPADAPLVRAIVDELGFVTIPGHGRGTHRFHIGYDPATRSWAHLDVVTDLAYGRFFQWALDEADTCLARRRVDGGVATLGRDDAFWTLLLHCLLDKGRIDERHGERLTALVDEARTDGRLGRSVTAFLPDGWDPARVRSAVRAGRWDELVALRGPMERRWWRRDPVMATWRYASGAVSRLLEPFLLASHRRGLSVALLGPDGAGKSTLADSLVASFGLPTRRVYMGLWATQGWRPPGWAFLVRPFVIWRRSIVAQYHRALGRLVIFDRYTYDALIPPRGRFVLLKRAYFWLLAHAAPAPDLTFVLDAPGDVLFARKGEFDPEGLERDRSHFGSLAARIGGVRVVDATVGPEALRDEVVAQIWRRYQERASVGPYLAPEPSRPEEGGGASPAVAPSLIEAAAALPTTGSTPASDIGGPLDRFVALALSRAGGTRRRLDRRLRSGGAVASVPAVLGALDDAGVPSARTWVAGPAHLTETGVTVVPVGPAGEPAAVVLKLPRSPAAARSLRDQARTLGVLRADDRLGDLLPLVPGVVSQGVVGDVAYLVETSLPGVPAARLVRDPVIRARVLPAAAERIGALHHRTGESRPVEDAVLDEWIDAPIRGLRSILADRGHGGATLDALDGLADGLRTALAGRTFSVGWIHGDYWPGNLLVGDDAASVTGIVDWDLAGPGLPALHDVVHLLIYTRRLVDGRELGDVVRSLLRTPTLDAVERSSVDAAGWGWPMDPDGLRLAVLLAWLRHVGTFIGADGHASNRIWLRRNVSAVLRDLASTRDWVRGQA